MAGEGMSPRVWPFPEALPRSGPWTIDRSELPRVDIRARRMWVPLGASGVDMCRRLHEMAHARWSWSQPPRRSRWGTRRDTFMAVEDARMHVRLRACGLDLSAGLLARGALGWFSRLLAGTPFPLREVTLALVAAYGTGTLTLLGACARGAAESAAARGDEMRRAAIEQALALAAETARRVDVPSPLTRDTARAARWLDEALGDGAEPEPEAVICLGHGAGPVAEGAPVPWGTLDVESPARTIRTRAGVPRTGWRAVDHGTVPRAWHRWPVDAAVFAERVRRGGPGAILVDMSGSMSLRAADVGTALARLPALTLATYSGSGDRGVLRIVARDGRRVDDRLLGPPAGHGNIVDGPALEWLAGQAAPRVWVSDGHATGVGDQGTTGNAELCARLCRGARIRRVRTLAAALAAVR